MTDLTDENELGGNAKNRALSGKSADEEAVRKSKGGDEGEGDSDSWGRGKAGAGAGIGGKFGVPPSKLKEIVGDWRHLDVNAVVEAVAEFFGDFPMRASANASVAWDNVKAKSFAVVNWVITFGEKAARDLAVTRDRTRTSGAGRDARRAQIRRPKVQPGMNMAPGPTGPTE